MRSSRRRCVRRWRRRDSSCVDRAAGCGSGDFLYADGIVGAIDESRILVLILSKDAVASARMWKRNLNAPPPSGIQSLRYEPIPAAADAGIRVLSESIAVDRGWQERCRYRATRRWVVGQHLAPGTATSPTNANQASAVRLKAGDDATTLAHRRSHRCDSHWLVVIS